MEAGESPGRYSVDRRNGILLLPGLPHWSWTERWPMTSDIANVTRPEKLFPSGRG